MIHCQNGELIKLNAFTFNNVQSLLFSLNQTEIHLESPLENLCKGDTVIADGLNLGFLCTENSCLTLKVTRKTASISLLQASTHSRNNQFLAYRMIIWVIVLMIKIKVKSRVKSRDAFCQRWLLSLNCPVYLSSIFLTFFFHMASLGVSLYRFCSYTRNLLATTAGRSSK